MKDSVIFKIKLFILCLTLFGSVILLIEPVKIHADEIVKGHATFDKNGYMTCSCPSQKTPHCGCLWIGSGPVSKDPNPKVPE